MITRRLHPSRAIVTSLTLSLTAGIASTGWSENEAAEFRFNRHEFVTGQARHQTVVPGFYLGGPVADLAVADFTSTGSPRLRVFSLTNGHWKASVDAKLHSDIGFIDVMKGRGRDRLILYRNGRLSSFDPASSSETTLLELALEFKRPDDWIPHADMTEDLNDDGFDDFVVPSFDGFWIATQLADGSFEKAVKLGPPEPFLDATLADDRRPYKEVGITPRTLPWYRSRLHRIDHDGDGKRDLAFWNRDRFDVYHQDDQGRFEMESTSFAPGVAFDSDGVYSLMFDHGDPSVPALLLGIGEKKRRAVLHSIKDMDGDGISDLVIQTLEGRTLIKQRSRFDVHLGQRTPEGLRFDSEPHGAVQPRGRAGSLQGSGYSAQWFDDFDGDGDVDLMFMDVPMNPGGMVQTLVGNSVPVNLEIYIGDEGRYSRDRSTRRKIRRFAPLAGPGNIFFPTIRLGDLNRDGRADLVIGRSPKELRIFPGISEKEAFAKKSVRIPVPVPYNEQKTRLMDLNRDGRLDVLIHDHPTSRNPNRPHRLITLMTH